jgi:hypothetical protein
VKIKNKIKNNNNNNNNNKVVTRAALALRARG